MKQKGLDTALEGLWPMSPLKIEVCPFRHETVGDLETRREWAGDKSGRGRIDMIVESDESQIHQS